MEELKINLTSDNKEVIIRTGEALPNEPMVAVNLSGNIESVLDFAAKRNEEIDKQKSHVIINRKSQSVILKINENNGKNYETSEYTISGKMVLHEYIEELGINKAKLFSIPQLINLFKLNRRFFASRSDHAAMVSSLTNFQAKTEIEFTNSNDFKGSAANSKITKVKHDIPLNFEMKIPVFEGMDETQFSVTIEVVPENGSLMCSFISVECAELIDQAVKDTFTKVKDNLKEYVLIIQ